MKFRNAILLVLVIFSIEFIYAEDEKGIKFEKGTWNEILKKASNENKVIFLDAFASWCGPCKWMAKNVFTDDVAAEFYNKNFINAKIDMEKGEGIDIAKKYNVKAYPTFLYIDGEGKLIHRTCGSNPIEVFIQNGKDALNPETQLITIEKKFFECPSNSDLAIKYFNAAENGCMNYKEGINKYLSTQKENDLSNPVNWKIINNYLTDYNSTAFKYLILHKNDFSKLYSKDSVNNKILNVYEVSLKDLIRSKDKQGYNALKEQIKKTKIDNAEKIILNSDLVYYEKNKEWKKYIKTAERLIDKYSKDDYLILNSISWNVFENFTDKATLAKAEKWAKNSVTIKDLYFNNDTYANILFKLGKNNEAKLAAEKAIELAKKEGADYKETEDLLAKITKK